MSQSTSRPVAYVLVESGLHAGARLELHEAGIWYSAGGLTESEYWLADPDLAEAMAEFALVDGAVQVRLIAGPQAIVGTGTLEAGVDAAFDQPLLWGGVSLRAVAMPPPPPQIEDVATEEPKKGLDVAAHALAPARAWAAARAYLATRSVASKRRLTAFVLAAAAVVVPGGLAISFVSSVLERHNIHESRREALSAQDDPQARQERARGAAQRLSDLIGLPSITATALDDKTLALSGAGVPAERAEGVRAAIAQFEPEFAVQDHIVYRSEGSPRPALLKQMPRGVDLVMYGPQGYLRGSDGSLYMPGALLPDGMRIDLIREGEVWLSRGSERAVLRAAEVEH